MCVVEEKQFEIKKYLVGFGEQVEHEEAFCLLRSLVRFPYDHMSKAHRSRVCAHTAILYRFSGIDEYRSRESISRRARFMSESGTCEYYTLRQALSELTEHPVFTYTRHRSSIPNLCS